MRKTKWKDLSGDPLTFESIRQQFQPLADYRISQYEYPIGTEFPAVMRGGTCIVLRGECQYEFESDTVTLSAGDLCDLPSGAYIMRVIGDESVVIVQVWNLSRLVT